jgi:RNA polymerase sigma-70 factor, ECF subfamily
VPPTQAGILPHGFAPARAGRAPVTDAAPRTDFDDLFRELYPGLFRYLHRMTGDTDVAEDIVQESFVRLLGRELPGEEARLWLYTVATNLFRDRARTTRRRDRLLTERPPTPTPFPRPDEALERERRVAGVRRALARIPERDRQILLMREEGFRYEEIARVVEVAPGSIGTLLSRATRRFVAVYDESLEDGG